MKRYNLSKNMKKRHNQRSLDNSHHLKRQLKHIREKFELEKNLKNECYYFILSNELLEQYEAFKAAYNATNGSSFNDCLIYLLQAATRKAASTLIPPMSNEKSRE